MRDKSPILNMVSVLISIVISVTFLLSNNVRAYESEHKKILILNSYNKSDPWEQSIFKGIEAEFKRQGISAEIDTEYLSLRKPSEEDYFEKSFQYFEYKFSDVRYDLIIACDNDAFNFLRKYKNQLFQDTAVVFTGVNNYMDSMIEGKKDFTGVAEEADIKNTIDIALKLHKNTEEVQVVVDSSTTCIEIERLIEDIIPYYTSNIKFNFIQDVSISEVKSKLLRANPNSIIYMIGSFKDNNNQLISFKDSIREICEFTKLPVYVSWDFLLGSGALGGVITRGDRQGELAAQVAVRVLNGEEPAQISVVKERLNSYYFDYKALKTFNIKMSQLPENSIIINKPAFPYSLPKELLWGMVMFLVTILLVGTSVLIIKTYFGRFSRKALIKRSEHFKKRAEENRMLYSEAIEYDKIKNEFFANISHELRTPLNVLLGTIQLFEMYIRNGDISYTGKDIDKKVYTMRQNCFRLLRLVNNLIDITKIDSGFFQLQLQNKDIVSIIEDITLSVVDYVKNKGLELVFDTEVEEKIIACDPDKIERVMLNLLSNAIKFTPEGGNIFVNISTKGEYIAISVKDSGIGIPEDKKQMIFERFRQIDKSLSRNREGSGIGLSLAKSLIEMHNGRIYVESKYGEGSEFIFEIPDKTTSNEVVNVEKQLQSSHVERINLEFSDIYT